MRLLSAHGSADEAMDAGTASTTPPTRKPSGKAVQLKGDKVVLMQTTATRRLIQSWCNESLAAGAHGRGRRYTGAKIMRDSQTPIVSMSIARDQHGVVGWAWVTRDGLVGVWVKESCRGRGLGRALTTSVLPASSGTFWASTDSSAGVSLYDSLGIQNRFHSFSRNESAR